MDLRCVFLISVFLLCFAELRESGKVRASVEMYPPENISTGRVNH